MQPTGFRRHIANVLGAPLMGNRIVPIGIAVLVLTLAMVDVAAVSL